MPLLFDMPLEALKDYEGRNPRPRDFDAFWEGGIAEMREIDPQVELISSDFQVPFAECLDLYFTGVGGARVQCSWHDQSRQGDDPAGS